MGIILKVEQIKLKENMSVLELIEEMGRSGVLGAGRVYRATQLLAKMIEDPDTTVFLSIAGPIVPAGMRKIIHDLIEQEYVDVLITSGANITHDLLEAFGGFHQIGSSVNDEKLVDQGIGRIGDINTRADDFIIFEEKINLILKEIQEEKKYLTISQFNKELGLKVEDNSSILKIAAEKNVPIFSPGIIDSMLGLQLWMFTQDQELFLDAIGDMHQLSELVYSTKKVGAIIIGGGLPKHYTLASNILKGGVDSAIQITLDRSEGGSLSGAPLEEAKSWAKARKDSELITVIGDATIIFPLILAGAKQIISLDKNI